MVIGLTVLCIVLVMIVGLMGLEIRRINRELAYINTHETNIEVTTNTNWPPFNKLAKSINESLSKTRQARIKRIEQERQIKQMLTNLTHDIKTPLTVAIGYIQLLSKNHDGDQNQARYQRIENNLLEVNYYLHYLMDFNLLQEKNSQLSISKVDVSKVLEKTLFNYYDELTAKGLHMAIHIQPGVEIRTDRTLLERAFQNLISNLLKYGHTDAEITLRDKDAEHFEIIFRNHTLQAADETAQLTDRFYTQDTQSDRRSTGLGLDIVRSLVTTLGGQLHVTSQDDTFTSTITFRYRQLTNDR